MSYFLFAVAALTILGVLVSIARIGKPREPLTPGGAVSLVVINAVIVTGLVMAALRIH